jgi:hypothetical protein
MTTRLEYAVEVSLFSRWDALAKGSRTRIYAIYEEDGAAWKFGLAQLPHMRIENLQIGNPRTLHLYAHAPATITIERAVHRFLRRERLSGEWFRRSRRTLLVADYIKSAGEQCADVEDMGEVADVGDALAAVTFSVMEIAA